MSSYSASAPLLPPDRKTIGVLGGMGPAATTDFMRKLVAATPARRDQDHIPTIVFSDPRIEDRSLAILMQSNAPFDRMLHALKTLEHAGAEVIAIPCNTAHWWFDALQRATRVEMIHIADAVAARADTGAKLGLLATRGTLVAGIYQNRLRTGAFEWLLPDEAGQALVDEAIAAIKAGQTANSLVPVLEALRARGAHKAVLACTELPIAMEASGWDSFCLDATTILAEECVARACATAALPAL